MVKRHPFCRITLVLTLCSLVVMPLGVFGKTIEDLRQELETKKNALRQANEKITQFQQNIQLKQKEARTLTDQIDIISDNISELELSIGRTVAEIEKTNAEIDEVSQEIADKEQAIEHAKELLSEYIRSLHTIDQQSMVTIFLKYTSFSEVINEASTVEELQSRTQRALQEIQQLHAELMGKKQALQDFKQTLDALRKRQEQQQNTLATQQDSKQRILNLTNAQEKQFQSLLQQAQQTHKQAEAEISRIDAAIREELRKQGFGELPHVGTFSWPIGAIFGVSCEFHCAGYPFAYLIGPHSGIDIPTYVGTPIKAPADGYVARLHDSGGAGYSYILLLHGDTLSTVYGHVSGFAVNEDQVVKRGTVIGYTGGAPGMHGAGLSSGPHLHFEVRKNNIPINPRNYL